MNQTVNETLKISLDAIEARKAHQIVTLNLQEISLVADYFVICHGNSDTQVKAIVDSIREKMMEHGIPIKGIEGYDAAKWVLVDLYDLVIHVFHRDEREFYNIERIWSDAKVVGEA